MLQGAILAMVKEVARELSCSTPSHKVVETGAKLAESGATAQLVVLLAKEARKKRPSLRTLEACCILLEGALFELRIAVQSDDPEARDQLSLVNKAVDAAVADPALPATVLIRIARAFAQAGLEPSPALKAATLARAETEIASGRISAESGNLADLIARMAKTLAHDPFAMHAEIVAAGAAFPTESRIALAQQVAASAIPAAREASLGFLLDRDPASGEAVLETLTAQARRNPVSSQVVERLVCLRAWLPPKRREKLDLAIRTLRMYAAPPEPVQRSDVVLRVASLCDGAGAQSLFALVKTARHYALASVLIKTETGVADAWVRDKMQRREAESVLSEIAADVEVMEVSADFVAMRLADALATNAEREILPPFSLLQVTERLGLGVLQPMALPPLVLTERLLAGLPPERTGLEATVAAHKEVVAWANRFNIFATWFEVGEAVKALLEPIRTRPKRIDAMVRRYLPARRSFWAEQCGWVAAIFKDRAVERSDIWLPFALVARDLAGDRPLGDVPLFRFIAEATAEAFATAR